MITGIDISEKNGQVLLDGTIGNDLSFVYIKASEALNSEDRCFHENITAARKNGLLVGAYHWLHPRLHVGQQAKFFMDVVNNFNGMLPPVVCLNTHRDSLNKIGQNVKTFLMILKENVGAAPVIYTSKDYWEKYLADASWASEFPLWLDFPGSNWPPQLFPWAGWTFWQHDYAGKVPGIHAKIGVNLFNGSKYELEEMVIQ